MRTLLGALLAALLLNGTTARAATPAERLAPIAPQAWDRAAAAHLLERAGFGGTPREVDRLAALGPDAAVRYLVNFDGAPPAALPPFEPVLGLGRVELPVGAGYDVRLVLKPLSSTALRGHRVALRQLYEGTEVITASADRLSWQLHLGPPPRAERTALPLAGPAIARDGTLQVVAATGWVIVLLNYVGWLLVPVLRRQREDGEA